MIFSEAQPNMTIAEKTFGPALWSASAMVATWSSDSAQSAQSAVKEERPVSSTYLALRKDVCTPRAA